MANAIGTSSVVDGINYPISEKGKYRTDMQNLVNALEAFQGATDPSQRALFAAQVQELIGTVNDDVEVLKTDGNPSDALYAKTTAVQNVFNSRYGILNTPVTGIKGDETMNDAAGKSTPDDIETQLSIMMNAPEGGIEFSQFISDLQKAIPPQ